jgi:hypothetical protein
VGTRAARGRQEKEKEERGAAADSIPGPERIEARRRGGGGFGQGLVECCGEPGLRALLEYRRNTVGAIQCLP